MPVVIRTTVYATLFIALVLVFLPAQLLGASGIRAPVTLGLSQLAGMLVAAMGAVLALWCIVTFTVDGRGTPAPFDPPRRLVVGGPYRIVRNPMYVGGGIAMLGAALFYGSLALLAYVAVYLVILHAFVVGYEEPTLSRTFGADYDAYRGSTGRWLPGGRRRRPGR